MDGMEMALSYINSNPTLKHQLEKLHSMIEIVENSKGELDEEQLKKFNWLENLFQELNAKPKKTDADVIEFRRILENQAILFYNVGNARMFRSLTEDAMQYAASSEDRLSLLEDKLTA